MPRAYKDLGTALLLNAFIMPGSGQILLGQKHKGTVIALLALLFVTLPLARYTLSVMAAIRAAAHAGSTVASSLHAFSAAWQENRGFILWCLAALAVVWIYGIVDVALMKKRNQP